MAVIIQIVTDASGTIVGTRTIQDNSLLAEAVQIVSVIQETNETLPLTGRDSAIILRIRSHGAVSPAVEQSAIDQVTIRPPGSRVEFVSEGAALSPLVLQDAAGKPKPLIVPFIDP